MKLAADAEEELREQLSAHFTQPLRVHLVANERARHVGLVRPACAALLGRRKGWIDENDPPNPRIGEIVTQPLGQLPREVRVIVKPMLARRSATAGKNVADVVVQVVVLEDFRAGEQPLAMLHIFPVERREVHVRPRRSGEVVLQVARAGGHVPQADVALLPPRVAHRAFDVVERLACERQRREELTMLPSIDFVRQAVDLGEDAAQRGAVVHFVVDVPEALVVVGEDLLDPHFLRSDLKVNAALVGNDLRAPALDVIDEVA